MAMRRDKRRGNEEDEEEEDSEREQSFLRGGRHHSDNFMAGRAISCSDLLLDLNEGSKVRYYYSSILVIWRH